MTVTHNNVTYECAVAVKCENDRYIKLYDDAGAEIASFINISDFSEYSISGGSFVAPCDCSMPISLAMKSIGGRTIKNGDWKTETDGSVYYEIESEFISGNTTTCNVFLLFANGTSLPHTATQETGKVILKATSAPSSDTVIESILITNA